MPAPIFISYSSRHRDLTRRLAAALEAQYGAGSVWWDDALEARGPYAEQIHAALQAARAVVVVWTRDAACSRWVHAEALAADAAGKLVHVRPADVPAEAVPLPFNGDQAEPPEAIDRILRAVDGVMTGRPPPTRVPLHELYGRDQGRPLLATRQSVLPDDPWEISPSQLLQARYEQVGYLDATGSRRGLLDWALGHPRRAAGRLLHGPGGVGKTRLLIDLAAELRRAHGWAAGFVEHPPVQDDALLHRRRRQALRQLIELGDEPGLLLVLDYAEGRRDELLELAGWIEQRPEPARRPVRLVLLARGAGEWWQRLVDELSDVQALFRERPGWPAVTALPPFNAASQRLALLEASCAAYRPVLEKQGLPCPSGDPPEALRRRVESGERRSRPLSIQMEALVWLAGGASNGGAPGVAELLDRVLGLERRHWAQVCGALDEASITELERGLAQVTLVQGVPGRAAAEALLQSDPHFAGRRIAPVDVAVVIARLRRLYGDSGDGLRPLEPDLLGEHLVARVADERLLDACVGWVDAGADAAPGEAALHRLQLVTVLQRATAPEHGPRTEANVGRLIDRLLDGHLARWAPAVVSTVVETPGALLAHLQTRIEALDTDALAALDAELPKRSLTLDPVALDTAGRLLEHERQTADDVDRQAWLAARYGNFGLRLSAMGRREDALAASGEAVRLFRRLAHARPDAFGPDLATSLNNLGGFLSYLGRREDALAATDEAVQIYRQLAEARPDVFGPDLATSLNNLGGRLSDLGRREDALAATAEAVQIHRSLAQARPGVFAPDLASSLNSLGIRMSDLGRREDALAATEEAVQIRRHLARARPDAFGPDLAMSLNNLGSTLYALGRREDALAATDEAMQIRRNLAKVRPDAFGPDLATSLNNLGAMLSSLGRLEDALAATDEAVKIRRGLVKVRPDAFAPDLAASLNNLGNILTTLGRREDALAATDEAVQIRRRLALVRPDAFGHDLAASLSNLGTTLYALGRREDALIATDEAVQVYRSLAQTRLDAFGRNLAMSLGARSMTLAGMGRHAEAAASAEEGLATLLPLLRSYPQAMGGLAALLAQDHLRHARSAGREPNVALLREVARILGPDQSDNSGA